VGSISRLLVGALAFTALAACAPRAKMGPVGVSTGGALESDSPARVTQAPPSPLPPNYRATFTRVDAQRFVALGHAGGRFDADVYVTPTAKEAAFGLLGKIEPGTILVMDESPHGKSASVPAASSATPLGPTLMMEKRAAGFDPAHGDWRYVVVDGVSVEDGALPLCASCHDEAPHDHVFAVGE
jgi:hypothetical protein